MLLPTDFRRAAKYMISRYGSEAGDRAATRANELREAGDNGLHKIWSLLAATVAELSSTGGAPGDSAAASQAARDEART